MFQTLILNEWTGGTWLTLFSLAFHRCDSCFGADLIVFGFGIGFRIGQPKS